MRKSVFGGFSVAILSAMTVLSANGQTSEGKLEVEFQKSEGKIQVEVSEVGWLAGRFVDIAVSGGYAYAAAGENGFAVIDVSDHSKPKLISTLEVGRPVWKVKVAGQHAYLETAVESVGCGFEIIDVKNPQAPRRVAGDFWQRDFGAFSVNLDVAGGYLYVTDQDGLRIFDVSNPESPRPMGVYAGEDFGKIAVFGGYAYVHGRGLQIFNVSDPAQPKMAGVYTNEYELPGGLFLSSGLLFRNVINWNLETPVGLEIYSVENPALPRQISIYREPHISPGPFVWIGASSVTMFGKVAYIMEDWRLVYEAGGFAALRVVDLSNPAQPTRVGGYLSPGAGNVAVAEGLIYLPLNEGLKILQTSVKPRLQIRVENSQIELSWGGSDGAYKLEQRYGMAADGPWIESGYTPNESAGSYTLRLAQPSTNTFFRLRKF